MQLQDVLTALAELAPAAGERVLDVTKGGQPLVWLSESDRAATALRAGRNRRRELLAAQDGQALVRALALWVGTETNVEDLLPSTPGLFDLVTLDEAAHIDQIRAAPVIRGNCAWMSPPRSTGTGWPTRRAGWTCAG
jgi:hypothetical protein